MRKVLIMSVLLMRGLSTLFLSIQNAVTEAMSTNRTKKFIATSESYQRNFVVPKRKRLDSHETVFETTWYSVFCGQIWIIYPSHAFML